LLHVATARYARARLLVLVVQEIPFFIFTHNFLKESTKPEYYFTSWTADNVIVTVPTRPAENKPSFANAEYELTRIFNEAGNVRIT
jgi:hypothetical protein